MFWIAIAFFFFWPYSTYAQQFLIHGRQNVIQETIPDTLSPESVYIIIRQGIETKATVLPMTLQHSNTFAVNFPDSLLSDRGLTCQIKIKELSGRETFIYGPRGRFLPIELEDNCVKIDTGQWNLISIPFHLKNSSMKNIANLFGASDRHLWRITRYLHNKNQFMDYNPEETWEVVPGRAFWLFSRKTNQIKTGRVQLDSLNNYTDTISMELTPGWNQIGLPFPVTLPSSNVQLDSAEPILLWEVAYNNGFYDYIPLNIEENSILHPWKGYWVNNNAIKTEILRFLPYNLFTSNHKKLSSDVGNWILRISLITDGGGNDLYNYLSLGKTLKNISLNQPPRIAPSSDLSFIKPDHKSGIFFLQETCTKNESGKTISLELSGIKNQHKIKIAFKTIKGTCPYPQIALYDRQTLKIYTDKDTATIMNYSFSDKLNIKLFFGTPEFIKNQTGKTGSLNGNLIKLSNFPNPFNYLTRIFYSVPDCTKQANVSLKIYATNGKLISTIIDGRHAPGQYSILWDINKYPDKKCSGIYLLKFVLDNSQIKSIKYRKLLISE
ncbi:MAG: hypothetical protein ABIA63_05195 [bacterium]